MNKGKKPQEHGTPSDTWPSRTQLIGRDRAPARSMLRAVGLTDEDFERLTEFAGEVIDFFAENALEHERIGETIDRIGVANFLEALGVAVDPNMVSHPRTTSYTRTDDWEQEAAKWYARKAKAAGTASEAFPGAATGAATGATDSAD